MDQSKIALPASLDLAAAEALKEMLIAAVDKGGDLVIDGSGVEKVGTPCIQLIVSASRTLRESGHSMKLEEPSEALGAALAELGLSADPQEWSTP